MKLAILTARTLGKVVGNIPLLGYILMGKDKSMTVGLKITGTLENPKIQTSATKDILTLPLDLIKRTFKSPARLIEKEEPVPLEKKAPVPQKKTPLDNLDF